MDSLIQPVFTTALSGLALRSEQPELLLTLGSDEK